MQIRRLHPTTFVELGIQVSRSYIDSAIFRAVLLTAGTFDDICVKLSSSQLANLAAQRAEQRTAQMATDQVPTSPGAT